MNSRFFFLDFVVIRGILEFFERKKIFGYYYFLVLWSLLFSRMINLFLESSLYLGVGILKLSFINYMNDIGLYFYGYFN